VVFAANILWKIPLVGSLWGEMVSLFTRTIDEASLSYVIFKSLSVILFEIASFPVSICHMWF